MSENHNFESGKPLKKRSKLGQWFVDLWTKFLNFLHEQFTGIFDKGKVFFTLVFLGGAIMIALISFFKTEGAKVATNIFTLTFLLGFLFLMIGTFIPALSKHLFAEEGWFTKIIITVIVFVLSLIITLIWNILGDDPGFTFQILRFSQMWPYIFIFIFLGWNILQIHFIKDGVNTVSNKVEKRLIIEQVDSKKKNIAAISFLVVSLIVPLMTHIFTVWVFWVKLGDPVPPNFLAWVVIIGLSFVGLDCWQVWLFIRSKKYGAVNVYSSFFYLLISLVIWFRSFGFITSFISALTSKGTNAINALGNIFLVILTAIFVLKMIATRVKISKKMNEDAIPFLVFALTIMYIAGQVVMIIGSVGNPTNQYIVNLTNNSILLVSSIVYYLWYSQFILQRKGYIKRKLYTIGEIKGVMTQFAEEIKETAPAETEKIDTILTTLLDEHKIEEKD